MGLSEADTRAKLIDPAIYARGWAEEHIRREDRGNPNAKSIQDTRTSAELLELIAAKGLDVDGARERFRSLMAGAGR